MARSSLKSLVAVLMAVAALSPTTLADARVDGGSTYSKAQTYSGALRYVRVDLGYEVVEKDPDAAYLIFKYTAPGGSKNSAVTGTLEVIEASGGGTRLFVNLPRMPEYYERVFRDGLLKKLKDEYGAPPPVAKKPNEKAPNEKAPAEKAPADDGDG
jgi:hypothetical protein